MNDPYEEYYDDDEFVTCPRCMGGGSVDCHCGGDQCYCTNQGERPCPLCHEQGEVLEEVYERYLEREREMHEALRKVWNACRLSDLPFEIGKASGRERMREEGGKPIPPKWQGVRDVTGDRDADMASLKEMQRIQTEDGATHFRATVREGQIWLHGWEVEPTPPDWEEPFNPWMSEDKSA